MSSALLQPISSFDYRADKYLPSDARGDWPSLLLCLADEVSRSVPHGVIGRVEVELPDVLFDPVCLRSAPWYPRFFWRSRETGERLAATGALVIGPPHMLAEQILRASAGVRFCGGSSFDLSPSPFDDWEFFPATLFFIPRAELIESGSHCRLALNILGPSNDAQDVLKWILRSKQNQEGVIPSALSRWDVPHFGDWREAVGRALCLIEKRQLSKVVLARRSRFDLERVLDPFLLAARLAALSPRCFHFCLEPGPYSGAFLGASPELLFRRRGRIIESEALAGTRPRSLDAAEDERLTGQLITEPKERDEHRIVVEKIAEALEGLSVSIAHDPQPHLLKLARIQHLRTAFTAQLKDQTGDDAVLRALHPTPATCGLPNDEALCFLRQVEPFDRGWYAGPIGVAGLDFAEFSVAIRSMHLTGAQLDVFAGAGIVAGSKAEAEWAELESKIGDALRLISA